VSSYAVLSDVQAFLPQWRIGADTRPAATEVSGFLTRLSARLDGIAAANGYATPVTGAQSLDLLKSVCLAGAGWYVGRTLFPQGGVPMVDEYAKEYQDMMQQIMDSYLALSDAPTLSSGAPLSELDGSLTIGQASAPFFTRGMQF
jgi:hypothetical protein